MMCIISDGLKKEVIAGSMLKAKIRFQFTNNVL